MTRDRWEDLMSKDSWSNQEFAEILGISVPSACRIAQKIKRVTGDRLGVKGRIHPEDYFEHFDITDRTRYSALGKTKTPISRDQIAEWVMEATNGNLIQSASKRISNMIADYMIHKLKEE